MGINERLQRLEARIAPPHEVPPGMDLLLKLMNNARVELDGEGEPEPLTLQDRRDLLEDAESFVGWYIPLQRERNPSPENLRAMDELERVSLEDMAELKVEIGRMEGATE
jgi:hypothetical protein